MAVILADGSTLALATAFGTLTNITAITNANPAVATFSAGHGIVVGDFVEINSGWPQIDGRLFRASVVATNDVTLEGLDTSSTSIYPAGSGTGTGRRITTWSNIGQVVEFGTSGGDQNYASYQFLNELIQRQIPTNRSAIVVNMKLADDPALAQVALLRTAEASGVGRGMRLIYRNGSRAVANGFWTYGAFAELALGDINKRAVNIALIGLPTEYST